MAARLPDPARSRAVLIGSARYRTLGDLPAVAANLTAVRDVLTDPVLGGFAPGSCTVLGDPSEPLEVFTTLRRHARVTRDTFLVYFAGHGLLGARNDLHLALAGTDTEALAYTALAYDQVRDVLLDCPARNRIVILDCCFAGAALHAMTDPAGAIAGQTVIEGSYILAAAPATQTALAPPGAAHTAFTGALLERWATGVPDGPELFTLADLFPRLRATLTGRGLPQPRQQGTDTVTGLALTRNPAHHRPTTTTPTITPGAPRDQDVTGTPRPPLVIDVAAAEGPAVTGPPAVVHLTTPPARNPAPAATGAGPTTRAHSAPGAEPPPGPGAPHAPGGAAGPVPVEHPAPIATGPATARRPDLPAPGGSHPSRVMSPNVPAGPDPAPGPGFPGAPHQPSARLPDLPGVGAVPVPLLQPEPAQPASRDAGGQPARRPPRRPARGMVTLTAVTTVVLAVVSVLLYRGLTTPHTPTSPHAPTPATSAHASTPAAPRYTGTLTGHTDRVEGVAWAPDGKTLATASHDKTARIWDAATGMTLRTLTGHTDVVVGVAYAPDGKTLVTTSYVSGVAFAPDGKTLATTSYDNTARIWDAATGKTLRTLTGHTIYVSGVAWAPDGKTLATASWDKTARIWDAATGMTLRTLTGHTDVEGVAYAPDGKTLATTSDDNTARIWDAATSQPPVSLAAAPSLTPSGSRSP